MFAFAIAFYIFPIFAHLISLQGSLNGLQSILDPAKLIDLFRNIICESTGKFLAIWARVGSI